MASREGQLRLEALEDRRLLAVQPLPVPFEPVGPSGTLLYETTAAAQIATPDETESFTVDLDGGQTLSLVASPAAGLDVELTVRDAAGAVLAAANEQADGGLETLMSVPIVAGGGYTIDVSGVAGATGAFELRALLNAGFEAESLGGPNNGAANDAEDLDPAFSPVAATGPARAGVLGSASAGDPVFLDSFDATLFDPARWASFDDVTIDEVGIDEPSSPFAARLNGDPTGGESLVSAVIDLSNEVDGRLSFAFQRTGGGDSPEGFEDLTVEYRDASGGWIELARIDGAGPDMTAFERRDFELPDAALHDAFQFRFTVEATLGDFDDWFVDDVAVHVELDVADWYRFTLADGESASLLMDAAPDAPAGLELYLADGATLVAAGVGSAGAPLRIDGFRDTSTDAAADEYLVRVAPGGAPYSLSVVRNGGFELEGDEAGSSDLSLTGVALGGLGSGFNAGGSTGVSGTFDFSTVGQFALNDGDGFLWDIQADGNANNGTNDAFDGGAVHNGFPFTFATADLEEEGREVVIGPQSIGDISVARKVYIPADQGFARFLEVVTNRSRREQSYTVPIRTNLGSDSGTVLVGESSGDGVFDASDHWLITDDFDGSGDPTVVHVISGPGGDGPSFAQTTAPGDDNVDYDYELTLAPGETQIVMHFLVQAPNRAAAAETANELANLGLGATAGMTAEEAFRVVNFLGADEDPYQFLANAGDRLRIDVTAPANGPGQFDNTLDPNVVLLDPQGAVVATDDSEGAVRIAHRAATAGAYTLVVTAGGNTQGEYALSVTGQTGAAAPLEIVDSSIVDGDRLDATPTELTIAVNGDLRLDTVAASDLVVNGAPATAVVVIGASTLTFELPPGVAEGANTLAIEAGAWSDLQGRAVTPFAATFNVDTTSPRVVESSVLNGDVIGVGDLVFVARFDEEIDASAIDPSDVRLVGAEAGEVSPDSIDYDPATSTLTVAYAALPEDTFDLTLLSGAGRFEDLVGNHLDGEAAGTTTVPSGDGVAGGDFRIEFVTDVGTVPFPSPFEPSAPLGGLVYDSAVEGVIYAADDVDSYTVELDAGQTLTFVVDTQAEIHAEVFAPDGESLASGVAAAPGEPFAIQTVRADAPGLYSLQIGGVDGSTGAYRTQLILNAAIEAERFGGQSNDSIQTPESLDRSFVDLELSAGRRAAVRGAVEPPSDRVVASEDFESGALDSRWTVTSTGGAGRAVVSNAEGAAEGQFALLMDSSQIVASTLNEAIWSVDLTGVASPTLSFSHITFFDERTTLPDRFTGSANGDGVSVSDDGVTWHTVVNAPGGPGGVWQRESIDLTAVAAETGVTLGAGFRVKFQQFDDQSIPVDGRGFDQIAITAPRQLQGDWFSFDLSDGESATLALTAEDPGALALELYGPNGPTLLATTVAPANADAVINRFVDTTDDGLPATYFARVSGEESEYTLYVTTGADFDTEPNNDGFGAQPLGPNGAVLGHVKGESSDAPAPPDGLARGGAAVFGPTPLSLEQPFQSTAGRRSIPTSSFKEQKDLRPALLTGEIAAAVEGVGEQAIALGATLPGPLPVLQQFAGPGSTGSIPADPIAAAGPEQVVAMVNTSIGIYDKETGEELFLQSLDFGNGFFGEVGATSVVFDPWVLYDTDSERFFAIAIDLASASESNLFIAVSTDSTPTDGDDWHKYNLPFTHNPDPSLGDGPHFADYPKLGVSDDAIFVSGNYFPIALGSGVYAGVTAFEKSALLSGGPATQLYQEFFNGFSVFPMTQYDGGSTQYFAESNTGGGSTVRIHEVSNVLTAPTRVVTDIAVPAYAFPDDVPQLGGGVGADSIDARVMTGVFRDGSMWFAHAADDPLIGDDEAVVRWYEVDVTGAAPEVVQAGNVDPGPGVHAWMPAISVDARGNMGVAFSLGGPERFLGAGFTGRLAGDDPGDTILPVTEYVTGTANYQALDGGGRNRWGDYSGLSVDPTDNGTFWAFNLYPQNGNTWATEIASFLLEEPADDDWYSFNAVDGDLVTVAAGAFAPGAREIANDVDLGLELYDPNGVLVGAATGPDEAVIGESLVRLVGAGEAGEWRVRVFAESATQGEYQLRVNGATGDEAPPRVIDLDPDNGAALLALPDSVTIDFSETLLATTVDAADVMIGGRPALSVTLVDGDTYTFEVDPSIFRGDGFYPVEIAAGAVSDLQGEPIDSFGGGFEIDTTGPVILGTAWNGAPFTPTIEEGPLSFVATFNEDLYQLGSARRGPFAPAGDDVLLTNLLTDEAIRADAFVYDTETDTFTVDYDFLPEGEYRLTLLSGDGGFEDRIGNDLDGEPLGAGLDGTPTGDGVVGGDYVVDFVVDRVGPRPLIDFARTEPLGGLVFDSFGNEGLINAAGDRDTFVFEAAAGEKVSFQLRPLDPAATLDVQLNGGPSLFVTGPGERIVLDNFAILESGTQSIAIGGDRQTRFVLDVVLNAAWEMVDGDSTEGAPDALDGSYVALGSGRFAALGSSNPRSVPLSEGRLFATPTDGTNDIVELSPADGAELNRFAAPAPLGAANNGLAFDGSSLFFMAGGADTLYELDAETGAVLDSDVVAGGMSFEGLAALDGRLYLTNALAGDMYAFNPRSDSVTAVLDVFGVNSGATFAGGLAGITGPNALVAMLTDGDFVELDAATGRITGRSGPVAGDLDAGAAVVGGEVYALAGTGDPRIAVYDRAGTLVRTFAIPYEVNALGGDQGQRQVGQLSDEPNDTLFEAVFTDIGPVEGVFVGAGEIGDNPRVEPGLDVDLLEVRLDPDDRIIVDVDTGRRSRLDSLVTLFDANGMVVAQDDNDGLSTDSLLDFTVADGGVYYVGVSGADNGAYDPFVEGSGAAGSTGAYAVSVEISSGSSDPLEEPNDTIPGPVVTRIGPGTGSYFGSGEIGDNPNVDPGLDVDLFEVTLNAFDTIVADVDASAIGSFLDPILTLFDANGVIVAQNDDFGSLDSFIETTVPAAGLYYVGVSGFANFGYDPFVEGSGTDTFASTGFYELSIDISGGAPFVTAAAAEAEAQVVLPEVDVYEFTAEAGETFDVVLTGQDGVDFAGELLELYAPDGTLVATATPNPLGVLADNFDLGILDFVAAADGLYRVRFAASIEGEYGLVVTDATRFDTEPNDDLDAALRDIEPGIGALGYASDGADRFDTYRLHLEAGQLVTLVAAAPPAALARPTDDPIDPLLLVFDSAGRMVARDADSLDGTNPIIEYEAPDAGEYRVRVVASGGGSEYVLRGLFDTPILVGDYNDDGVVSIADYSVWRNHLGSPNALPNDPTPGVTALDFNAWRLNFGATAPVAATADAAAGVSGSVVPGAEPVGAGATIVSEARDAALTQLEPTSGFDSKRLLLQRLERARRDDSTVADSTGSYAREEERDAEDEPRDEAFASLGEALDRSWRPAKAGKRA